MAMALGESNNPSPNHPIQACFRPLPKYLSPLNYSHGTSNPDLGAQAPLILHPIPSCLCQLWLPGSWKWANLRNFFWSGNERVKWVERSHFSGVLNPRGRGCSPNPCVRGLSWHGPSNLWKVLSTNTERPEAWVTPSYTHPSLSPWLGSLLLSTAELHIESGHSLVGDHLKPTGP